MNKDIGGYSFNEENEEHANATKSLVEEWNKSWESKSNNSASQRGLLEGTKK